MLGRWPYTFLTALGATLALTVLTTGTAQAQYDDEESASDEASSDDESSDDEESDRADRDSEEDDEEAAPEEGDPDSGSPVEKPGKTYHFLGLRYRPLVVPKFMMNMFGSDGGDTVWVHSGGPEFGIRRDDFEYIFSLWFANYGMDPTPFKGSNDDITAWEIIESKVKVLYLTADFLWSAPLSPQFAINYGLGAGFGLVWGDLYRTQAFPRTLADNPPTASNDPDTYIECRNPASFNGREPYPGYFQFCGTDNKHYDGYTERSWANGGSKPIIFPWLFFQTGFRYKPHRHFVARVDLGFGTSGFLLGVGLDYGL